MDFVGQIISIIIVSFMVLLLMMVFITNWPFLIFFGVAILGGSLVWYGYKKEYRDEYE